MAEPISSRIEDYVASLPLRAGMRLLEIGCGPGVAARLVSRQVGDGFVLGIDRSAKAIRQAEAGSQAEMATGRLGFQVVAIEDFERRADQPMFDLAFAMRVGALDGRHPELEAKALARIKAALRPDGMLHIDERPPIRACDISSFS